MLGILDGIGLSFVGGLLSNDHYWSAVGAFLVFTLVAALTEVLDGGP